ncbi:MAG: flavodoxin [Treponema sp.]
MKRKIMFFLSLLTLFLVMPVCSAEKKQAINKNNKVLVVYYSQTGTTKQVANIIAKRFNASLFELKPKMQYTDADLDWTNPTSRVCVEHNKGYDAVNVELENINVQDFESYDVVFIGYPIWWKEASWVVDSFVKNNDFSNKNIFAFCTSISSGTGESMQRLAQLAGTGKWIEGKRFSSNVNEKDVISWLKGLKY